jgi:hypothetical protein
MDKELVVRVPFPSDHHHVVADMGQWTAKARRLRHLAVDKGLLREVKQVQRVLDSLVLCKVSLPAMRQVGNKQLIGMLSSMMMI